MVERSDTTGEDVPVLERSNTTGEYRIAAKTRSLSRGPHPQQTGVWHALRYSEGRAEESAGGQWSRRGMVAQSGHGNGLRWR